MSANPTPARADPFASLDSLGDFKPVPSPRPKPVPELVRQVSEASNFPSRSSTPKAKAGPLEPVARPPQRRHRTGRNVQMNLKVTAETSERFTRLSTEQEWVFGETLAHALDALEIALRDKATR